MNLEITPKDNTINTNGIKFEKLDCLKVDQKDDDGSYYSLYIIPDHEYTINFYCECNRTVETLTGMVKDVYKDQIRFVHVPADTSKYDLPETLFIPVNNIFEISEVTKGE